MTLKAISCSYPWLTWIIITAFLSIRFSVKHQSTGQTVDSCSKWHEGHLESNRITIIIIIVSICSYCSRFHSLTVDVCSVCKCVDAFLSEFYARYLCVSMCASGWLCAHPCRCVHICDWDHSSPGFRFLSCSTASHLAPVPKIVMLEKRKGWMRHDVKEENDSLRHNNMKDQGCILFQQKEKKDKHNSSSCKWKMLSIILGGGGGGLNLRPFCKQWNP